MKSILTLVLSVLLFACDNIENQNELSQTNNIVETEPTEHLYNQDFSKRERVVKYGNDHFIVSTTPFLDSISEQYSAEIMLRNKKDTFYSVILNTDSLLSLILQKDRFHDSIPTEELLEYRMVSILPTRWVRGYNSYLNAKFVKAESKDLFLRFAIKAFTKDHRIWFMSLDEDGKDYQTLLKELEKKEELSLK